MQKPALLASLLTVLGACAMDRVVIGDAYEDAGSEGQGDAEGSTNSDELSARYAKDIEGEWQATFVAIDVRVNMHMTVTPSDAQPRSGTFSIDVSCPAGCSAEDAGRPKPPSSFDVEYWFLKPQPGGAVVILTGELFNALGPTFGLSPQCGYYLRPQRLECGPATFTRMGSPR